MIGWLELSNPVSGIVFRFSSVVESKALVRRRMIVDDSR